MCLVHRCALDQPNRGPVAPDILQTTRRRDWARVVGDTRRVLGKQIDCPSLQFRWLVDLRMRRLHRSAMYLEFVFARHHWQPPRTMATPRQIWIMKSVCLRAGTIL